MFRRNSTILPSCAAVAWSRHSSSSIFTGAFSGFMVTGIGGFCYNAICLFASKFEVMASENCAI